MRPTATDKRSFRSRLRAERGSMLIEVMVGAIVLAIATTAILDGLDGAQSTGARNKARSVAATLAQQDIERLRSIPVTALSNLNETRTVPVAGVNYTVVSRTEWVRDASGVVTCSNDEGRADYLKLTSTVSSPTTAQSPVTETGLLTPALGQSNQSGTATVRLTDRDGDPLVGVSVSISGPSSRSAATNALGCAVFGFVPSGTYTASVPGFVDVTSVLPANEPLVVYTGKASFGQMQVDRPASIRASFVAPSGTPPAWTPVWAPSMRWDEITVKNINLPGGSKAFSRADRNVSVDAADLFPFTNGVGVYAGDCPANDPSTYLSTYFQQGGRGFTALDPGDLLRPVDVAMPTLRITVYRSNTTTNYPYAEIKLTPLDPGCTATYTATSSGGSTRPRVFDVAVPFGRYRVCAATRSNSSSSTLRRFTTTATSNPPDQALTTVPPVPNRAMPNITTGSTTGGCLP